jgi:hypothetical protein
MSFFQAILTDLREKRLWPVAVALLVAIVAVPVVLAKSSSPPPVNPATTPSTGGQPALPAITVDTGTTKYALTGLSSRDPFTQQASASSSSSGSGTSTTATGTTTGSSGSTGSTGGAGTSGSTSGGSGTSTTTTTTTTTTSSTTTAPAPPGLTATEAYHVAFSITNSAGGVDAIDPLERLSIIPSAQQPLLVELGVLQGGNDVLFVVQPGTIVTGPGTCMPGPIDCQVLSLAANQTETLSQQTAGSVNQVALFAVTSISKDSYQSSDAADAARKTASGAGLSLLSRSTLSALSLFQYDPTIGAVVDLRNLTVGGG